MNKQNKVLVVGVFSCAAILFGVAGCGNNDSADSGQAQQTQGVQTSPNMSPQARAAAEASMKQGQAMSQAQGQAAAQAAKK